MTDRERNLLWMLMEFNINRYLLVNTPGREDGFEKSERHMELVKTYMAYEECRPVKDSMITDDMFDIIHNKTQELTDNLDVAIGFPLDGTRPNYDLFAWLFFEKFIELAESTYQRAQK